MTCDLKQLDLMADGELRPWNAWRLRRHIAHCPTCAAELAAVQHLTQRARAWRSISVPAGLVKHPNTFSTDTQPYTVRRQPATPSMRWASIAATAVAVLIGVSLTLSPHSHAIGSPLQQMETAVHQAHSVHMTLWWRSGQYQQGPMQKVEEDWYQNGKWRKTSASNNGGDRIILSQANRLEYYHYDTVKHRVISLQELAPQQKNFSLEALAGEFFPTGANPQVQVIGRVQNGNEVRQEVRVSLPNQGQQMLFWLQPQTNLPIRAEKQVFRNGHWATIGQMRLTFNQPISPSVFDPKTLHP